MAERRSALYRLHHCRCRGMHHRRRRKMAPHLALAENDGLKGRARKSADRGYLGFPSADAYHPLEGGCNLKRWPAHLTALMLSR